MLTRGVLLTIAALGLVLSGLGCRGSSGGVQTGGNQQRLASQEVADPALHRAAELIDDGRGDKAFRQLSDRFETQPQAAYRDMALWLAAHALIEGGNRIKAFYYLDQLMDEHPDSPLYYEAALKQYEIADSYLRNNPDRWLFLPLRRYDEAAEMLFRVQQRLPGSPLAEQALKRTADFYFARGDHDFAEDAYGVFIDRFPRSPIIPVVRLKQAYANLLQYEGPRYDPTALLDAATQLRQFAAEFPDLAREQNIPGQLAWIDEQLAEKLMIEADYYRRTGEPDAAGLLLAQVASQYPDTSHAQRARRRLDRAPSPATMPSGEAQP
jgi:outer membrane assembly lipoprotein YfiO